MNEPTEPGAPPEELREAVPVPRSRFRPSLVWLTPAVAALIALWLVARAFLDKGPEITVTFRTAEGLEIGRTPIKYRSLDIGTVSAIDLTDDRGGVVVTARMKPTAAPLLVDDTALWVVRPRVALAGVSGLGDSAGRIPHRARCRKVQGQATRVHRAGDPPGDPIGRTGPPLRPALEGPGLAGRRVTGLLPAISRGSGHLRRLRSRGREPAGLHQSPLRRVRDHGRPLLERQRRRPGDGRHGLPAGHPGVDVAAGGRPGVRAAAPGRAGRARSRGRGVHGLCRSADGHAPPGRRDRHLRPEVQGIGARPLRWGAGRLSGHERRRGDRHQRGLRPGGGCLRDDGRDRHPPRPPAFARRGGALGGSAQLQGLAGSARETGTAGAAPHRKSPDRAALRGPGLLPRRPAREPGLDAQPPRAAHHAGRARAASGLPGPGAGQDRPAADRAAEPGGAWRRWGICARS